MNFPNNFYKATDELNTYGHHVPAPYIRRRFDAPGYSKAYITVTGLGFYELWLNGHKITKGLLAPYISNPGDIVYFDRYDVTELMSEDNVVGLMLGNGMQNSVGGRIWDFDAPGCAAPPCYAMSITYVDDKGCERVIEADGSFRCHPSPVIFDDLRCGCFYDANLECDGWLDPSYDDSGWYFVLPAKRPDGEFRLCGAAPVVVTGAVRPVGIRRCRLMDRLECRDEVKLDTQYSFNKLGQEGILFDFGVNTTGIFTLKLDGRPGQQIFIQTAEQIRSDGIVSFESFGAFYPDGYGQTAMYICRGQRGEEFTPSFTFYGFRYAVVFGLEEDQIGEDTLTLLTVNGDLRKIGGFSCSDETMNKLGEMAERSDLANFMYFPTDCPHREKNGWTGDAAVSAEHYLLTLTVEKSLKEWLRNICRAQRGDGALPGIIPTYGWGFDWGNGPAWDNVLSELCYMIYRFRGDLSPARECADSMYRYLRYIAGRRREDGLIEVGLGDWLQPGRRASRPTAPLYLTDSVITMYIADKSYKLFTAMGMKDEAEYALRLHDEMRGAIRANCIDRETMEVVSHCQTAQAICIFYGVFDAAEKPKACDVLVRLVHEKGDHFDCGMIGMRVVFHVLSDCGCGDLAFRMITRRDFPSYGMLIDQGLTTLAESFQPPEEWDHPASLDHHFMGDITSWFISKVVGIRVNEEPDGNSAGTAVRIDVRPDFIAPLDWAEAYHIIPSPDNGAQADAAGCRVNVRWQRDKHADGDNGVELIILTVTCEATDVSAPSGRIILPEGYMFADETTCLELRPGVFTVLRSGSVR